MDTVFYENTRKKISIGDFLVAAYIIAIFVLENEKYATLFSAIQLVYFGYMIFLIFQTKKFPLNIASKWILVVAILTVFFLCVDANKNVNLLSFIVIKNLLKSLCVVYYLYVKGNDKFLIGCIAVAGVICGGFIVATFLSNPIVNMELKYAYNSRIGAEIAGDNVNVVAMNMCFAFSSCIYLIKETSKKNMKLLWCAALIFVTISSFFTGTRKILLVFVVMLLLANNNIKIRYKIMGCIAIVGAYWMLMNIDTFYFLVGHKIDFWGNNAYKMYDQSDKIRQNLLIQSWGLFCDKPWGGGFGYTQTVLGLYAHNNYLEILVSLGLIGVILYYYIYIWGVYKSYCYRKDSACHFCLYTLVGIMLLEIGQITCYYPMIYIFIPLMAYIIRYKRKRDCF